MNERTSGEHAVEQTEEDEMSTTVFRSIDRPTPAAVMQETRPMAR